MTRATIRLSLATAPNPVFGTGSPRLALPAEAGLASLELRLLDGPLVSDRDFITDYSGPSPDRDAQNPHLRRYRSLATALEPSTLGALRTRVCALLERLLDPGESWFAFGSGATIDEDDGPEERFSGAVYADGLRLNGRFDVFEIAAGDMDLYGELLGDHDRIAGLAAPAGRLRDVLGRLTLADALPTSQRYRPSSPFHPGQATALTRVMTFGRLFFEEVDNGTRLSFVTRREDLPALRERLAPHLDA